MLEAEAEAENKILTSRPACPRGLNITVYTRSNTRSKWSDTRDEQNWSSNVYSIVERDKKFSYSNRENYTDRLPNGGRI